MLNFFIILFLFAFFVLSLKKLDWAVMAIIAGLPLYLVRFKALGVPLTMLEAMILIAFFCWFVFRTKFWDFLRGKYLIKNFFANSPWRSGGSSEGRKKYPFGVEIVLLLIISFIAAGTAGFSDAALGIWKAYFFEPALLYVLILNIPLLGRGASAAETGWVSDCLSWVKKIGLSLAAGAFAVSVYAVWQKITGLGINNPLWAAAETRRVVSFFGYPNAVGLYLAPLIPVLAAFLFFSPKKEFSPLEEKIRFPLKKENISVLGLSRGFLTFIIILSILAIVFAGSEGALVGLAAAFIVGGLLGNKKTRLAVLAFAVAAVIAVSFVPCGLKTAEQKLTLKDFSGQVRRYQWKETLIMLTNGKVLAGAGLSNYQKAIAPLHQPGFFYDDGTDPLFHQHTVESAEYRTKTWRPVEIYLYPHNIILNFWSELGLFGALLFIWILGKIIYHLSFIIYHSKVKKNRENMFLALGLLGAVIAIIIHGLVDVPYFKNDLSAMFWILIAILVLVPEKNKNLPAGERKV
jgi:O-antigen ligase